MTDSTPHGAIHPAARCMPTSIARGKLSRREFLTRATALGVSATAAYGADRPAAPAAARRRHDQPRAARCASRWRSAR